MTTYRKLILSPAVLAALLWSAAALPAEQLKVVTQAMETSSDVTPLPNSVPDSMSVRACGNCKAVMLRVDEDTKFQARNENVTLPELRAACGRKVSAFTVVYVPQTKVIKRVVSDCEIVRPNGRTRR